MTRKRPPGPVPRDSSGPARTRTVRTTDAEEALQIAAAARASLSLSTWRSRRLTEAAARELESASTPTRRFSTLEEVVRYLDGLDADDRAEWLSRNAYGLVVKPTLLRAAITQAWLAGDGWAICAACESFARGER